MTIKELKTELKHIEGEIARLHERTQEAEGEEFMAIQDRDELIELYLQEEGVEIVDHDDTAEGGWGFTVRHNGKNVDSDGNNRIRDYNDAVMVALQHLGVWAELQATDQVAPNK